MLKWTHLLLLSALVVLVPGGGRAETPLPEQIDTLIAARGKGKPISPQADDAEFLRRVYLDLVGTIPPSGKARAFLDSKAADKRTKLVDELLASAEHPRRMQELFHVMFMERLGEHPAWTSYLQKSFAANKPFDQLAREILRAASEDDTRGAAFFFAKRLESYGANPVEYPALARDVGRLFLGKDLRCAQCHDHLFIKEYKQADFQGLFAFVQHTAVQDASVPSVAEKALDKKLSFMSVFTKVPLETGPRLPGGMELAIPTFKKGEEYSVAPDPRKRLAGVPKFSPLTELARTLPRADNPDFSRNIVNRIWFILMGRGLVHPLDQHHKENPPSHPEILDLLAREFVAHKFDLRWLLRELVLSKTYQRSSLLPEGTDNSDPALFLTMAEKRLLPEQLLWATLEATGEGNRLLAAEKSAPAKPAGKPTASALETTRLKFIRAFGNSAREPEEEFAPGLKSALFVLNDSTVLELLTPKQGNLIDRLDKITDKDKLAEELYLSILTRRPSEEEKAEVARHLAKTTKKRSALLGELAWALLASTEFAVNH